MLTYLSNKGLCYRRAHVEKIRKAGSATWPVSHQWTRPKELEQKWHELICDHCLGAETFNNGSTCQIAVLLPNKVTNSPLAAPSCAWHKAPIVTSHSHSNNFSSKWHCTTTGHFKGAEKKDFASVLSCRHQGGGGLKPLDSWQMVIAKCLYCLCLNKQPYYMRVFIVLKAICHECSPLPILYKDRGGKKITTIVTVRKP